MPDQNEKPSGGIGRAIAARLGFSPAVLTDIDRADATYNTHAFNGGFSLQALQGNGARISRNRQIIYREWQAMLEDPIVSSALRLHCTAALGGHETSGDVVFIECRPEFEKDKAAVELVNEIRGDLCAIFNRVAYSLAFNAAGFGDAYARIYSKPGAGVTDMYADQCVMPAMVQAYERGSTTAGYVVYIGQKQRERLTGLQMARVRMPRIIYEPQPLAIEIAWRAAMANDDIDKVDVLPALAGGSMLQGCEEAYSRYLASLLALIGKRAKGSIDAAWLKVNVSGMSKEAQDIFLKSVENAQNYLKALQRNAVETKNPILESVRFMLPVSDEKQVTTLEDAAAPDGGQGYSIEDVMLHAKLLAGALGIDLSMLGFSELLSGGLGEGGFFRTSAQAAERSRMLRVAVAEAFEHVIDVHLVKKKRVAYAPGKRPWQINFYSTISALEAERAKTRDAQMASTQILVGILEQLKNLGMKKPGVQHILSKVAKLDEATAQLLAKELDEAEPENAGGLDGMVPGGMPPGGGAPVTKPAEGEDEDA